MNVLITGATGFIGQHLLEELAADDIQIKIISRQQNPKLWCNTKQFTVFQADISHRESLTTIFQNVDVVISLAAELRNTEKFELTNTLGVKNIIEFAQENGVKKIIHLSSVGVVGMQYSLTHILVEENTPCNPKNKYESTKLEAEKIVTSSKLSSVIIRPTNVFGDHHPRRALLGFFQRCKSKHSFPIKKDAFVNYVYVKDVAHAIRFALLNDTENRVVNIGEGMLLKDFIEITSQQLNVGYKINNLPTSFVLAMEAIGYLGNKKLKAKLRGLSNCVEYKDDFIKNNIGYKYGLKTGVSKSVEYYTNQGLLK